MPQDVVAILKAAVRGLRYPSEKDALMRVIAWPARVRPSKAAAVRLSGLPEDAPVETASLDAFFAQLVADQPWHGAAEKDAVERFRKLHALLNEHLEGAKVFKVGRAKKKVYVVGKTNEGAYLALETDALET